MSNPAALHMCRSMLGHPRSRQQSILRWLEPVIPRFHPLHRMMAGQKASRSRAEAGFRTTKLREQDLRRRAAALGPVPIHVHFQNGLVLQVTIMPRRQIVITGVPSSVATSCFEAATVFECETSLYMTIPCQWSHETSLHRRQSFRRLKSCQR